MGRGENEPLREGGHIVGGEADEGKGQIESRRCSQMPGGLGCGCCKSPMDPVAI